MALIHPNSIQNSLLERHTFADDTVGRSSTSMSVSFYVYYNATTPILYEVMPFIRALKFVKEAEVLASIPNAWIKHAGYFADEKFKQFNVPVDTAFAEYQFLTYLISLFDSKSKTLFVKNINEQCFRKIENTRLLKMNQNIFALEKELISLKAEHAKHTTFLTKCKDTLEDAVNMHASIQDLFGKLIIDMVV